MLTTGEVAKLFHVSAQTVINWLEAGRLPFERMANGPRRLTEATVLQYIRESGISREALDPDILARVIKVADGESMAVSVGAIVVLDRNSQVISWNEGAARLFGVRSEEILGQPIDVLRLSLEGWSTGLDFVLRSRWEAQSLQLKGRYSAKSGQQTEIRLSASRLYGIEGQTDGYVLVIQ